MSKKVPFSKQHKIDHVKRRMEESGVTQSELADAVGQSSNYICSMLSGTDNISGVMFLCINHYIDKVYSDKRAKYCSTHTNDAVIEALEYAVNYLSRECEDDRDNWGHIEMVLNQLKDKS